MPSPTLPLRMLRRLSLRHVTLAPLLGCTLLCSGCGIEIGNPKKPKDGASTSPAAFLVDDQSVAGGLLASQVDQTLAATAEEAHDFGGASSLALNGFGLVAATPQVTSTCTQVSALSAQVKLVRDGSFDHTFSHGGHSSDYKASMLHQSLTSLWASPTDDLPCAADLSAVTLDWAKADGLTLDQQFVDSGSVTITREHDGKTLTRSSASLKTGTRHAAWQLTASTPQLNLTKVATSQFTDSLTLTRRDGTSVTLDSTVATEEGAPLTFQIVRDPATQAWTSKTLVSGTVLTTLGGDSRVEATYAGLTLTVAGGCAPQAGTISGRIFHGAETAPTRTFQVTFDGFSGQVVYDDGTTDTYVPGYCDLDDGSGAAAPSPID